MSQPNPKILVDSLQKQFNKLGKALDSGNLPAAQVAYQSIQKINKKATVRLMQSTPTPRICRFE